MKNDLKTYGVYAIKVINGQTQFDKDGNPVLEDKPEKTVRMNESDIKILNSNATGDEGTGFGKVYIQVKEKAKNLFEELKEEAKELGIKGYQLIKDPEKLQEKINEAKKSK